MIASSIAICSVGPRFALPNDRDAYTDAKEPFVERIVKLALEETGSDVLQL